jgi:acyl-CoA synthetase (AMP-forming)/AMP-acid ligase II
MPDTNVQQRNAYSIVARHARTRPDALALTGMGRRWTYRELAAQTDCIAGAMARLCTEPQARIAIIADNHPLTCLVYLAAARAGMIVSLVNSLFKATELAVVFEKLAPQMVIFDPAHRTVVKDALAQLDVQPLLATLERDSEANLPSIDGCVDEWTAGEPFTGAAPQNYDCAEISWTSGTTSAPKGVMLTHDIAIVRAETEVALFELTAADTAAVITPLFHQSGIRNTVLVMWVCGGHAVVLPRFDVRTFWTDMLAHSVTYLCMVETILLLLDRNPFCAEEQQSSLRTVLAGANPEVIARCEKRFGFRVVQVWGMTEAGVATGVPKSLSLERVNELRTLGKGAFLAGWPASEDTHIRLVANGEVVNGEGATGEIQMSSGLLFSGYFRDDEATASAFDGRWMKTGDVGSYGQDGALYFVDRLKDVIRRGGENIASKQVEDVLLAHPQVRLAAVVPVPDPLFVQEVKAVLVTDGEITADDLWSWCEERLARYKVPRYIEFRDALPVNGSGRIQKQQLVANAASDDSLVFDRRATTQTT